LERTLTKKKTIDEIIRHSQHTSNMNLTNQLFDRKPTSDQVAIMKKIISHAEGVTWEEMFIQRPNHRASAWRSMIFFVFNRFHGIPQATLASWFGLTTRSVCRGVKAISDSAKTKEGIRSIVPIIDKFRLI